MDQAERDVKVLEILKKYAGCLGNRFVQVPVVGANNERLVLEMKPVEPSTDKEALLRMIQHFDGTIPNLKNVFSVTFDE